MRLSDMRSGCRLKSFHLLLLMINAKFWNFKTAVAAPEMLSHPFSFIEHEVTEQEAKESIKNIEPQIMNEAGCKECNRVEIEYCLSTYVLSDHCCCDRKYHETFPYMEHKCTFGDTSCQTMARDCSEYSRIVECCCHQHLAKKWKTNYSKSQAKGIHSTSNICSFCILANTLTILIKYITGIS